MPIERLVPNVERRLSGWVTLQDRLHREPPRQPALTLTISRQFGCEAYPLAEQLQPLLAARTGHEFTIWDKELVARVSRETRLSERLLANLGGETHIADRFAPLLPGWRTHGEAYEQLARYVLSIAREGYAIIIGRGGAVLTRELPNCVHIRLEAPVEQRVASVQHRLGISPAEAAALVAEHQLRRDRFIEEFLHCSMADTRHYHALYNTARTPLAQIARSIIELLPVPPG